MDEPRFEALGGERALRGGDVPAVAVVLFEACGMGRSTRGLESTSSRDMDMVLPALPDRNILFPGVLDLDPAIRDEFRVPDCDVATEDVIVATKSVRMRCAVFATPA